MEAGTGGGRGSSPATKPSKFAVYQNPALSAALTANSIQPSKSAFLFIFTLSSASAFALLALISWENGLVETMKSSNLPQEAAYVFTKAVQTLMGSVFIASIFAIFKALTFYRGKNSSCVAIKSLSKEAKDQPFLTNRQLGLMGSKPKFESLASDSSKKPPKSKPTTSPSDVLVPIHQQITGSNRKPQVGSDKPNLGSANKLSSLSSPSSLYLVPGASSPLRSAQSSPGIDSAVSTPWSSKRASAIREITTEEQLEQFLASVDERITESARVNVTPPPTIRGYGVVSPNTVASSASASGTKRSTPLRPVRMSPSSQKFTTPPKKEGDFPPPMSMEESVEAFKDLGMYPQIEQWRDRLRQWFSSVVLNPLLNKIETSHIQVMQAAAKLGISITISPVGNDPQTSGIPATISSIDRKEWQPSFTLDEDGLLQQLRLTLLQSLDASTSKFPAANPQQTSQQIAMMQECVDAITEHQRLHALMKGEWAKGLLSHSNVPESYTVQRIQELAEGTCLKNYEYMTDGVYEKKKKTWSLDLPTDSHLLLYLFCAFLEHPKWMLHVDPSSYAGGQSSRNPLFLGVLPPKERFPEKYISVVSVVPSVLHPGACVLAVGKQMLPIFALYWDKKLQLSLQGRSALWDSILVLCHRIKVGYGGIVRGMHLSSSALSILPVLQSETNDP